MAHARRIAAGILNNWLALAVSLAITFFLSPFVVNRLGAAAYGVWVLVTSSVSYMNLLDLGMRSAVISMVAKSHASEDHLLSSRAVSAALAARLAIAALALAATAALTFAVGRFPMPAELVGDARLAMIACGLSLAVTLTGGVFGAVLNALRRFDLSSGVAIFQACANGAGVLVLLLTGHGIVAIAVLQLVIATIVNAALLFLARRVYPQLEISLKHADRGTLRALSSYSVYAFLITVTGQIIYYTDNIVVGAYVSAAAITLFSIGGRLIEYHKELAASLAQTLMPYVGAYDARGEQERLRQLLIYGTRAALLVSWPIEVLLWFRGETFIALWMGRQYAGPAAAVLRILLLSNFVMGGHTVSGNITFGLGRHKPFALWRIGEAAGNLLLSIILVQKIGINGVAWGTTVPSLVVNVLIWPLFIARLLGISLWTYVFQAWIRTAFAVLPFAYACYFVETHWTTSHLIDFVWQSAVTSPLLVFGLIAIFWPDLRRDANNPEGVLRRFVPSWALRV